VNITEVSDSEEDDLEDSDQSIKQNNINKNNNNNNNNNNTDRDNVLLHETVAPKRNLPPLLIELGDRTAERLHYLGVSFGLTKDLYTFWSKASANSTPVSNEPQMEADTNGSVGGSGFQPVYLRQTANELTGEFTCIMLRPLLVASAQAGTETAVEVTLDNPNWINDYASGMSNSCL
jgi:N-acetyltransferase 10